MQIELTRNFMLPRTAHRVRDDALRQLTTDLSDTYESTLTQFRDEMAKPDPRLSPMGQQQARLAKAQKALSFLGNYTADRRRELESAIKTAEKQLLSPQARQRIPDGADREDWRWAEREVRDRIAAMDPIERSALYRRAVRAGDVQTIRAFELAPAAFPLLSPEDLEWASEAFAEAQHPEEFAVLQDQRMAFNHIDAVISTSLSHLEKIAHESLRPDPIAERAATMPRNPAHGNGE